MSKKSIHQLEQERKAKGRVIFQRADVHELRDGTGWTVLGDAHGDEPRRVYEVKFRYADDEEPALFDCTCEDYARHAKQITCKHGHAVEMFRLQQAAAIRAAYALPPLEVAA